MSAHVESHTIKPEIALIVRKDFITPKPFLVEVPGIGLSIKKENVVMQIILTSRKGHIISQCPQPLVFSFEFTKNPGPPHSSPWIIPDNGDPTRVRLVPSECPKTIVLG